LIALKSGKRFDFQYHIATYYSSDAEYRWINPHPSLDERYFDKSNIIVDYESYINELGFAFNILDNLQVGFNMRVYAYFGGFLDVFVDIIHLVFLMVEEIIFCKINVI